MINPWTADKWDRRYMDLAKYWADECSKDPSTKVGAVIVSPDNKIVSLGYNGFPSGIEDTIERLHNRDTKIKLMLHAERNALDNVSVDVKGCTMYSTLKPCLECAKSIIQKGIVRVVCYKPEREDKFGWDTVDELFAARGIEYVEL